MTDLKNVLAPLLAIAILTVIGFQTSDALRSSGLWTRKSQARRTVTPNPYARLDAQIATPAGQAPVDLRDPFAYGRAPTVARKGPERPKAPPPPPKPVLTAILSADNDLRAFLRYEDRNYTVKAGDLFADFSVVSITASQVVLDRNGTRIILFRPTKGD